MSDLPPPSDLGLPPRFQEWRESQAEAVEAAINSTKRFTVLCLPTGVGKSVAYMVAAKLFGMKTAILTATRGLQDQLKREFGEVAWDQRGMANYPCETLRGYPLPQWKKGCDSGPCLEGSYCTFREAGCAYFDSASRARDEDIVSTNYAYWLSQSRLGARTGEALTMTRDMLVLDEAHEAADELSRSMRVELQLSELEGSTRPIADDTSFDQWREWAMHRYPLVQAAAERQDAGAARKGLLSLAERLYRLKSATGPWVVEYAESGWSFEPLWPAPYRERLFCNIPRVLLVSATIRPAHLRYLGIKEEEAEFHEWPSPFPAWRRPVYWIPTARLNAKTEADPAVIRAWANRHDQIMRKWRAHKGLIHTKSYGRAQVLREASEYGPQMTLNSSRDTGKIVEGFKASPPPAVLVSPSVSTGHDFPGDLARWQVISKLPYPDSRGPLMRQRCTEDKQYANLLTVQELVQATGRIVRGPGDYGATFIVDDSIGWFLKQAGHLAPKWWLEGFQKREVIPEPPPILSQENSEVSA